MDGINMKKYNSYITESTEERKIKAIEWLLKQPFIKKDEKSDNLLIIKVKYKDFPESLFSLNKREWTELNYVTLVRLLLFSWLYKYDGTNDILLKVKEQLKKGVFDENLRFFTQIPTNISVMKKKFSPIVGNDITMYSTDPVSLGLIILNKDKLFTEANVLDWYNFVSKLTKKAIISEENTIKFIKDNKIFKDALPANDFDDKLGIDIWLINYKDEKIPAQVKLPKFSSDIDMFWGKDKKEYKIIIKDTALDMKNYNKFTDGKLIWKFLFLWDLKKNKLYQINSSSINRIYKHKVNNYIYINLNLDDKWLPKMIKIYEL